MQICMIPRRREDLSMIAYYDDTKEKRGLLEDQISCYQGEERTVRIANIMIPRRRED